jgi:hypothetical protein
VNYPFDKSYRESVKNPNGDIIMGIDTCIKKLKSKETSIEDQEFYLKFLIHLMGDLHQPLHVALADDKGGNDFQVRWFSDGSNLHRVWDSNMIDSYKMSYTEIADNISDGKKTFLLQYKDLLPNGLKNRIKFQNNFTSTSKWAINLAMITPTKIFQLYKTNCT